jgi:RimJ/RimL family protein N-acetyltransferase
MVKEDFYKVIEWNTGKSQDFLTQWAGPIYTYPLTEEQLQKFFNDNKANNGKDMLIYKIVQEETVDIVGTIELRKYEKEENTARVGRFLIGEQSARGKGIGEAALSELVRIGFEDLKYDKICLGVFDFNNSAIACYKKVGFEIERLIEKYRETSNGYWNLYEMSIYRDRWENKTYDINH